MIIVKYNFWFGFFSGRKKSYVVYKCMLAKGICLFNSCFFKLGYFYNYRILYPFHYNLTIVIKTLILIYILTRYELFFSLYALQYTKSWKPVNANDIAFFNNVEYCYIHLHWINSYNWMGKGNSSRQWLQLTLLCK